LTTNDSALVKGSKVLATWHGGKEFYSGIVLGEITHKYHIGYDFSSKEWVEKESVVLFEPVGQRAVKIGSEVYATIDELHGKWMPGVVRAVSERGYLVSYNQGHTFRQKWLPITQLVLRRRFSRSVE
jgi:hypothetical protein